MSIMNPGSPDDPIGGDNPVDGGGGGGTPSVLSGVPWGPAAAEAMPAPRFTLDTPGPGLHVLLYDASGYRKNLAQSARWSPSWQNDRYGGFGQGALAGAATAGFAIGDRIDIYFDNYFHYRGYVEERSFASGLPDANTLTLYGRSTRLGSIKVLTRFNYPTPVDASVVAAAIWAARGALVFPWMTVHFPLVGVPVVGVFDYADKSTTDAYNDLAKLCGDRVCWGIDIDGAGVDRIYFQATGDLTATDYTIVSPSQGVGKATGGDSIADVRNIVTIDGADLGDVYSQKIVGGGFENPVAGGKGVGSLLENGSFENGSNQIQSGAFESNPRGATAPDGTGGDNSQGDRYSNTDYWHVYGGGSVKQQGEDSDGANAQDGSWWLETDGNGEGFSQAFRLPVESRGKPIGVDFWARPEQDGDFASANVYLSYRDATTGTWTDDTAGTYSITPNLQAFQYYEQIWQNAALSSNADLVKLTVQQSNDVSEGQGIRWDSFSVWDNSKLYQPGWQVWANGSASVGQVDWAYTASRVEGGYALRIVTSAASDTDGQEVVLTLQPSDNASSIESANLFGHTVGLMKVIGGQALRLSSFVKSGPTASTGQKLDLQLLFFKDDKSTQTGSANNLEFNATDVNTSHWVWPYLLATAPNDAAYAYVCIKPRSASDWLIDGVSLLDSRWKPWGPTVSYQPDGSFRATFQASAFFSAATTDPFEMAAIASQSNPAIGPREDTISADILSIANILDIGDLYKQAEYLAEAFFRTKAVPSYRVSIPISGQSARSYWPGSSARIIGTIGSQMQPAAPLPAGLPIATVKGGTDAAGMLQRAVDCGSPQATTEALIMQTAVSIASTATRSTGISSPASSSSSSSMSGVNDQ